MRIESLDIRCCRHAASSVPAHASRDGQAQEGLEFLVYTLTCEDGSSASMFGFAGRSALGAGNLAAASLREFFVGRNVLDRERAWHDWRAADRWWHHLPIYSYGPVDCCLWLAGAQAAGQPLWRYIGGARSQIPVYASSLVLADAEAYAAEAMAVKAAGMKAYKTHPPGRSVDEDIEIHRVVRAAVGEDFTLMADPVQPYTLEEAVRFGRELERLGYKWLEEPLPDEAFGALRELTRVLDIPVVGTEVIAKHPYSVAECLATRVVDAVRADPSWTGGITGTLKTARLAESFHANCELHTTILYPLELVNLHLGGAVANSTYFELLWPTETFEFGLAEPLPIADGVATLPEGPGLGIDLDWDLIDNATFARL
ncbi:MULTISPECIES: enolase C-terminal domain-like protein [unclassified Roseitalea]|uniref:enolase C-terminal domain-like protein n=1 Tax=unclassified Roseitalea TaxID=2639107 RepID=UPI00273F0F11|nr:MULTISPECIES: enolase C-terminal domain-like protein [unclassified Roseitalea]